jgi:phosphoribosylformylglycinamidine synthase subunit PurL
MGWIAEGHEILLIGPFSPALEGSELEKQRGGLARTLPELDLGAQARALQVVRALVAAGLVASIHDVADGGLACALAESCIATRGQLGARVDLSGVGAASDDAALFGEAPGGWVVSVAPDQVGRVEEMAGSAGVVRLGQVGGDRLIVTATGASLEVPVSDLRQAHESGVADRLR